jgi:hypothetical protein
MAINALDNRTRTVLSAEASQVGFLGQHPCAESIIRALQSDEVAIDAVRVVNVDDERTATVYRIPATAAASLQMVDSRARLSASEREVDSYSQDPGDELPATGQVFAAEWSDPVATGQRAPTFQYQTLLFASEPEVCEIHLAAELVNLCYQFEFGDLDTQYVCETCMNEVHWADVPTTSPAPQEVPLPTRAALVKNRQCGCQGGENPAEPAQMVE